MTPEQEQKLNELYEFMKALMNSTTIPQEVDSAFKDRFTSILGVTVSSKGVNEEDISVNEGGASTHTVLGDPDRYLRVTADNGNDYDIPVFDA